MKNIILITFIFLTPVVILSQTMKTKVPKVQSNGTIPNIETPNEGVWNRKGISKFELLSPSTGNWSEILFTNPLKYIDIRNNSDLLFQDLDILSAIVGADKIGFYKSARFIKGKKVPAGQEFTDKYEGVIELLDNNNLPSLSNEAVVFFYYDTNNKMGCIQINNKFCMCKARIYITDYGMRIGN